MQVQLSLCPPNYTFRIGDKAAYVTVVNTPHVAHIYRSQGLIVKIGDDRATLKFPDGRTSNIPLKSLSPAGPMDELTRAFYRRAARRAQRAR